MISYVETHIVDHCNLNCIGCTHYSPLSHPVYKNIWDFTKEIAQLATLTNQQLPELRLLGGEPLLHPRVLDFCFIARKAFPYTKIELVTNGLLLLKQPNSFFEKINTWDISIYFSDYNIQSEKIQSLLKEKVNKYRIGKRPTMIMPSLNLHGDFNIEQAFADCNQQFDMQYCVNLKDGRIYHCPTEAYFPIFATYYNLDLDKFAYADLGIDIFNHSLEDIELYLKTPSVFCKYCDVAQKMRDIPYQRSKKNISEWTV